MTETQLIQELEKVTALRENRKRVSNMVLQDMSLLEPLVSIVFRVEEKVSVKAAWVFEFVVKTDFNLVLPYVELLSHKLAKVHFGDAVRSLAKILQIICIENDKHQFLTPKQRERFIEITFDWMISKHKVAIKVYAMQTLLYLGRYENWVHQELKTLILKEIDSGSPAYKARGRMTLEQLVKWNKKSC